jgi:hypothetical protein
MPRQRGAVPLVICLLSTQRRAAVPLVPFFLLSNATTMRGCPPRHLSSFHTLHFVRFDDEILLMPKNGSFLSYFQYLI